MTEPTPPETMFRRYRDQGDPAALAAVFDQTAPRLLLLAAHVTPDAAAAEDLLQETFLAAMEAAPRWDDNRPLLPWLAGILRHKAMHLARHGARERRGMERWQCGLATGEGGRRPLLHVVAGSPR